MEELKRAAHVVGTKQVLRGLKSGTLARVYVANDADTFLFQRVRTAAEDAGVPVTRVESMKELGAACGIGIDCAAAGPSSGNPGFPINANKFPRVAEIFGY